MTPLIEAIRVLLRMYEGYKSHPADRIVLGTPVYDLVLAEMRVKATLSGGGYSARVTEGVSADPRLFGVLVSRGEPGYSIDVVGAAG